MIETTSLRTADAVWMPPAPGPDIVTSVIAGASTITALNGPVHRRQRVAAVEEAGKTRTLIPPSRRSATPSSFSERSSSRA